jgi:hypothetical protein
MPATFLREVIVYALARPEAHLSRCRFSAVRPPIRHTAL